MPFYNRALLHLPVNSRDNINSELYIEKSNVRVTTTSMLRLLCVNAKVIPTTISSRGLYCSSVLSNGTLNHCVTTTSRISPSFRCVVGHQTLSRSLKIATPTIQQLTYANSPGIRSMNTQQEGEKKQQSFWQSITQIERVKQVLRDYGVVAVLFHTSMSLCVLGGMYTLVDQ